MHADTNINNFYVSESRSKHDNVTLILQTSINRNTEKTRLIISCFENVTVMHLNKHSDAFDTYSVTQKY